MTRGADSYLIKLLDHRISVVLPVYSETESLRTVVEWLTEHLGPSLFEIIIVVSPASSRQSQQMCQELANRDSRVKLHLQRRSPGLGNALREGISQTQGNVVLLMDADGEMENDTVINMLAELIAGNHDLVVASRWSEGGGFVGYSRLKLVFNWCFQLLFRWLYWTPIHDLTYGFKAMRGEVARGIGWKGVFHEIACETTLKPIKLGMKVTEVPSRWTARRQGVSKNNLVRTLRYVSMAVKILLYGGRSRINGLHRSSGDRKVMSRMVSTSQADE